ncbi:MAG: NADH dehydrogenase subunit [bacterium]|nr:NADH dehydrogenase subunit [bacterium]
MKNISSKIRNAGVVGAGGAGFPSYVKLESQVKFYIVNGAECEPLLHKDKELMKTDPETIIKGLDLAVEATGASRVFFAAKRKYPDSFNTVNNLIRKTTYEMLELGNFYPSGDEYELVYLATGTLIPPGGIPLQVDTVVNNVETLYNIARAAEGKPVVDTLVTVNGEVNEPSTFWAPVGCSLNDILKAAGDTKLDEPYALSGGAMMGSVENDFSKVLTRTSSGIIVVPHDHHLVEKKSQTVEQFSRIGKSTCDQCSDCTAMCPRYLLGYAIEPHTVMRSLGFTGSHNDIYDQFGLLCCECNICSLYACPENLNPKQVCVEAKKALNSVDRGRDFPESREKVHEMKDSRRVPLEKLTRRLGLTRYNKPAPFKDIEIKPEKVIIHLKQHVGVAADPIIDSGARVERGETIAEVPEDKLGVNIHASISGKVTHIDNTAITIER